MGKVTALNAFVHIPKTAGTTVNRYLLQDGGPGQDHVEVWRGRPGHVRKQLERLDWVSGHMNFLKMRALLCEGTARPIRFFSAVRDPLKQIASHYNWLIEIHDRGAEFYETHPPHIKEISERIRATDNQSAAAVIKELETAPGLFLNQQARTVFGDTFQSVNPDELEARFSVFDFVASEATLPRLIETLTGRQVGVIRTENKSQYHFDFAVFQSEEMQSFLQERHAADFAIYDFVKRKETQGQTSETSAACFGRPVGRSAGQMFDWKASLAAKSSRLLKKLGHRS